MQFIVFKRFINKFINILNLSSLEVKVLKNTLAAL